MFSRAALLITAAATVGAGCTDARGSFDDYGERVVDADTTEVDAPIVSSIPDVTGDFLVAARPPLPEDRFFYFRGTIVFTPVTENTGMYEASMQPLDFTTFEPVGDPITAEPVPVDDTASFDWPLVGVIPAAANSVTQSQVTINGAVEGTIITADFMCGAVTGIAGSLPLEGSTFGAVRITGTTLPDPIHNCDGGPTAP